MISKRARRIASRIKNAAARADVSVVKDNVLLLNARTVLEEHVHLVAERVAESLKR